MNFGRSLITLCAAGFLAASVARAQAAPSTKQATKQATKTDTKQDTKAAPPATKAAASATKQAGQGQPGIAATPPASRPPVIMREVYDYDAQGRRDPFFSLLATAELRPTVADLRLVGILYDPSGRRSVVTLRDLGTNERYQVTTGTTLGRMKVVLIRPNAVFFSIEEYGLNRQDSLVLRDTTKARAR
jgi:Ni/Co efflux regulator RcnB